MKYPLGMIFILTLTACTHPGDLRAPSSIPKHHTQLESGTRIVLKQPIPFVNPGKQPVKVNVVSRKYFSTASASFKCQLSALVPAENTYFLDEGTEYEIREVSHDENVILTPKQSGPPLHLSCQDQKTGQYKGALSREEIQMAFPKDVLVVESKN